MSNQSPTSIKVEVSRKSVPHGIGFSVSAAVSPTGPNRVHGDVEFFADGMPIAQARTDSTGVAAVGIPGGLLPAGEHDFGAIFHGDPYNAASKSESVSVMLEPAPGEAWPVKKAAPQHEGVAAQTGGTAPTDPNQPQPGNVAQQAIIPTAPAPLPPVAPNPEAPPPPPPNPAAPVPPVIPTAAPTNTQP